MGSSFALLPRREECEDATGAHLYEKLTDSEGMAVELSKVVVCCEGRGRTLLSRGGSGRSRLRSRREEAILVDFRSAEPGFATEKERSRTQPP